MVRFSCTASRATSVREPRPTISSGEARPHFIVGVLAGRGGAGKAPSWSARRFEQASKWRRRGWRRGTQGVMRAGRSKAGQPAPSTRSCRDLHDETVRRAALIIRSFEGVAVARHRRIDSLARQAALVAPAGSGSTSGLAANESAHDGRALNRIIHARWRAPMLVIHLANGLDEAVARRRTRRSGEQQDVAGWAVGTIRMAATHARLDGRSAHVRRSGARRRHHCGSGCATRVVPLISSTTIGRSTPGITRHAHSGHNSW